jgi:hypothetical protein
MYEVFLVSVIYWTALLVIFVWLNRRLTVLRAKITDLEGKEGKKRR